MVTTPQVTRNIHLQQSEVTECGVVFRSKIDQTLKKMFFTPLLGIWLVNVWHRELFSEINPTYVVCCTTLLPDVMVVECACVVKVVFCWKNKRLKVFSSLENNVFSRNVHFVPSEKVNAGQVGNHQLYFSLLRTKLRRTEVNIFHDSRYTHTPPYR